MEDWKIGWMEDWMDGRREQWKIGRIEGWTGGSDAMENDLQKWGPTFQSSILPTFHCSDSPPPLFPAQVIKGDTERINSFGTSLAFAGF